MSKMSRKVNDTRKAEETKAVVNFMGGISYEINPLDTLKMVTASSIFGEPQYYRDGEFAQKGIRDGFFTIAKAMKEYVVECFDKYTGKKTSDIMEDVIDEALRYDFRATIEWAVRLRNEFNMRLNPQVIMVRAACMTEERKDFTAQYPGVFYEINSRVMARADDCLAQMTYYIYKHGGKKNIPGVLKRSWAKKIESLSAYEVYKYRNHDIGLIDGVRICHANNEIIDELMRTGTVEVKEEDKTWETLRASGKSWIEIIDTIRMPHMALLRNLRGIFKEITDIKKGNELLELLKSGVEKGKQFPFRYMSALRAVEADKDENLQRSSAVIYDTLEECMDISCANLPKLSGNNAFLSDNSGSAWGTFNSEYGSVTVANIDNLSAVIGAVNSERGTVIKFGDDMKKFPISRRKGILEQAKQIDEGRGGDVGYSTENGVWLFFREAIDNKIVYDNIFIYSDMQAGHGGLYGTSECCKEYTERGFAIRGSYVDVAKLANTYRSTVNPKVNIYCIQTAGYNNVVLPENGYRTNILYGWTGKELIYADIMNRFWDEKDRESAQKRAKQDLPTQEFPCP
ncbi:TROVE domain-containing protein [bacterium]|nr:TROVE domain-containing protein [bacterium]